MKMRRKDLELLVSNVPLSIRRKEAIKNCKTQEPWHSFVLLSDGRLEYYFGTEQTKRGFALITFDPPLNRKRPNIPQYSIGE